MEPTKSTWDKRRQDAEKLQNGRSGDMDALTTVVSDMALVVYDMAENDPVGKHECKRRQIDQEERLQQYVDSVVDSKTSDLRTSTAQLVASLPPWLIAVAAVALAVFVVYKGV